MLCARKWSDIVKRDRICKEGLHKEVLIALSKEKKVFIGCDALNRWTRSRELSKIHVGNLLLAQILLLLGGDVELNPGDRGNVCELCSKPVKRGSRSIQCSECNGLSHLVL